MAWFAPTPPLEALKLLISDAATIEKGKGKKCIMINDVVRAYFEAPVKRDICIELPQEDLEEGESNENLSGRLEMSLYGTRNAASNFQDEVKAFMTMLGFRGGRYNACTFWHSERILKTVMHGYDFWSSGREADLLWLKTELEKRFELKTQLLGHRQGFVNEGKILNRIVRTTKD